MADILNLLLQEDEDQSISTSSSLHEVMMSDMRASSPQEPQDCVKLHPCHLEFNLDDLDLLSSFVGEPGDKVVQVQTSHVQTEHNYQKLQASPCQTVSSDAGSLTENNGTSTTNMSISDSSNLGVDLEDLDVSLFDGYLLDSPTLQNDLDVFSDFGVDKVSSIDDNLLTCKQMPSPETNYLHEESCCTGSPVSSVESTCSSETAAVNCRQPFPVKEVTIVECLPPNYNENAPRKQTFPIKCLKLSCEERELLSQEGVSLPEGMPLTKSEEGILKKVRRKIRNKVSALNSRRKKKEYVSNLEHRVKLCSNNNNQLQKRIKTLEDQNVSLLQQLKRLQGLVTASSNRSVQASTCVMVLAVSFALVIIPGFTPLLMQSTPGGSEAGGEDLMSAAATAGSSSRTILSIVEPLLGPHAHTPDDQGMAPTAAADDPKRSPEENMMTPDEADWFHEAHTQIRDNADIYAAKEEVAFDREETNVDWPQQLHKRSNMRDDLQQVTFYIEEGRNASVQHTNQTTDDILRAPKEL